jgi:small subunit ribosomal protein S3
MGQKVNPTGFRVGVIQGWGSKWYAEKSKFADFLYADWKIRNFINKRYPNHGISKVSIERKTDKAVKLTIFSAKPGVIIGQGGQDVEKLRDALERVEGRQVFVNVKEVKEFATNAKLIAETVAQLLERRQSFRRAMGQAIIRARRMGCEGIKVRVSGRLGGAEMSRVEWAKEGRVPLHTIRADIDYGTAEANTAFGIIGVKAWVFNGEVYPERAEAPKKKKARS